MLFNKRGFIFAYLHEFCGQFQNVVHYIELFFLIWLFLHLEIQIDLKTKKSFNFLTVFNCGLYNEAIGEVFKPALNHILVAQRPFKRPAPPLCVSHLLGEQH